LKSRHTLTFFELNPLKIYISASELNIDKTYFENIFKDIPHYITIEKEDMFNSDICLLPENIILQSKVNYEYPYNFLSTINDISFSIIQNEDAIHIDSFRELNGKTLGIIQGGYIETSWNQLLNYYKFNEPPKYVYYKTDAELKELLESNEIDAMASLAPHPNSTIFYLSTVMKIRIVPWNEDSIYDDTLRFQIKGLKNTKIQLKYYSSYIYNFGTYYESYGFSLALFIRKTMRSQEAYQLTERVFRPDKIIIRPNAIILSEYIPIHNGTRDWLTQYGYISIYDGEEKPHCILMAGKGECKGKREETAKVFYSRDFNYNNEVKELDVLPYLKEIDSKKDHPLYGKNYKYILDNSYKCIGHPYVRSKSECEKVNGIWDKPCIKDTECPFYKKNQNYENEFGGCNNGLCEMPLNVQRIGFTNFTSKPICHNDPYDNPTQCKQDGMMVSPDYAFKNDRTQRLRNITELNARNIGI
tara:strand:+ start:12063 stop:13478 length:1416 start_codon:yes stop_codon:yes gene_type:complete